MRGLAVVIMIQCHVFNSFSRLDLRNSGPYILSQFVGGMAAPLFMFMAGMTFGFQMESLDAREPDPRRRWLRALRRAGYIMAIAFAFRGSNWLASLPRPEFSELTKVDILNCMGLAMGVFAVAAAFTSKFRVQAAIVGALAVAAAAPIVSNCNWNGTPVLLQQYLAPTGARGLFPFFPCAAYIGFGLAAGAIVRRTPEERIERMMQWSALAGFGIVFVAQYFANVPYSIYSNSSFWLNSPSLILIRVGVSLVMLSGAFVWTQYGAGKGWSWMQALGRTSLMVYWVHVMLVYGNIVKPLKRTMSIPQTSLAVAVVTALMVALAAARLNWKARRMERWRALTSVAGAVRREPAKAY